MTTHECREFAEGSRRALAGGPEAWRAWIAERTDIESCTAALLCESYCRRGLGHLQPVRSGDGQAPVDSLHPIQWAKRSCTGAP